MTIDPSTSVSLLMRLQDPENPRLQEDWDRFVSLYTPLFLIWTRQRHMQESDASDLLQTVFVKLFRKLPTLRIDPNQRFRGYLFRTLVNAYHDFVSSSNKQPLTGTELEQAMLEAESDIALFEEQQHREMLLAIAFTTMRDLLSDRESQVCRRIYQEGEAPAKIAEDLGLTMNQVYLARSRGVKKVKDYLKGLLD